MYGNDHSLWIIVMNCLWESPCTNVHGMPNRINDLFFPMAYVMRSFAFWTLLFFFFSILSTFEREFDMLSKYQRISLYFHSNHSFVNACICSVRRPITFASMSSISNISTIFRQRSVSHRTNHSIYFTSIIIYLFILGK